MEGEKIKKNGEDKEKWRRAKEQEEIAFFPVSH